MKMPNMSISLFQTLLLQPSFQPRRREDLQSIQMWYGMQSHSKLSRLLSCVFTPAWLINGNHRPQDLERELSFNFVRFKQFKPSFKLQFSTIGPQSLPHLFGKDRAKLATSKWYIKWQRLRFGNLSCTSIRPTFTEYLCIL